MKNTNKHSASFDDIKSHPLVRELWQLSPNAPYLDRISATYRAYESSTNKKIEYPVDIDKRKAVAKWLQETEISAPTVDENGHSVALLYKDVNYTKPIIHSNASSKANWLAQATCLTCIPNEKGTARPVTFSVRTRPFSAQSLRAKQGHLKTLKSSITKSMEGRLGESGDWGGTDVCVTVVAIFGRNDTKKDADNIVKGLLDALQGATFSNDSAISHLSVHKVVHVGDEAYYKVSIRPVIDVLADVIDPEVKVLWPGIPEIKIDD